MSTTRRFEAEYRVRFDEAGADGLLRSSGHLRYAQDVAWQHSEAAGFDRSWYRERGLQWLVRFVELDQVAGVPYGETVRISTEVIGWRRVWARRRSEIHAPGREAPVAVLLIDWVLLDAAARPTRIPPEIATYFSDGATFTPGRVRHEPPPSKAHTSRFTVRPQHLDPLAHVNNAAYLDLVEETLLEAGAAADLARLPRRYGLEYLQPAGPGDAITATAWHDERHWSVRLTATDGREQVRATLESDPADWVGG